MPSIAGLVGSGSAAWWTSGAFAAPCKLAVASLTDPRWSCKFAVAYEGRQMVGILPLYWSRNGRPTDPVYNVYSSFSRDSCRELPGTDRFMYIGGYRDLETGWAASSRLCQERIDEIGTELVSIAVQHALDHGYVAAALYVRDTQAQVFRAGFGVPAQEWPIADEASIALDGPDFSTYLSALPASHRSIVRRDLRRFMQANLRPDVRPARELIQRAAPLVAAVKIKHGMADHPQLAAFRLESWMRDCPGDHVAFAVMDESELLCVSFACGYREILALYEIGMPEAESKERHLAYLHALVYSPIEYALQHQHTIIRLGLAVGPTKTLRGAVATPMRAFAKNLLRRCVGGAGSCRLAG